MLFENGQIERRKARSAPAQGKGLAAFVRWWRPQHSKLLRRRPREADSIMGSVQIERNDLKNVAGSSGSRTSRGPDGGGTLLLLQAHDEFVQAQVQRPQKER